MITRRNPDVLSNITTLAVLGAAGLLAYEVARIKLPNLSLPPLPDIKQGVDSVAGKNTNHPTSPTLGTDLFGGGSDPGGLNDAIDFWFNGAGGFFGIGSYDPTQWSAFRAGVLQQASVNMVIPDSPTTYFLTKSTDWAQAHQSSNPYGFGYHG